MDNDTLKIGGDGAAGGFSSSGQAIMFERLLASRRDLSAVSARELHEGTCWGDAVYLVDALSLGMGVHPFREVEDICVRHDNGDVPVYMHRGTRFLAPDDLVLIQNMNRDVKVRHLPDPLEVPSRVDLGDRLELTGEEIAHPEGGSLSVAETFDLELRALVVWRRDRRSRLDLRVVAGHSTTGFAAERLAEHALRFSPGAAASPRKRYRERDVQRDRVYRFEARLDAVSGYSHMPFDSTEACAEYLASVYADGRIARMPAVGKTRSDSEHSHFSLRHGIRLSVYGHERWTVLHEAAHDIAGRIAPQEAGHGPAFVGVLVALLETYAGVRPEHVEQALAERPVKIDQTVRGKILGRFSAPEASPASEFAP